MKADPAIARTALNSVHSIRCRQSEYRLYNSALKVHPGNVKMWNNLGRFHEKNSNLAEAYSYYNQAMRYVCSLQRLPDEDLQAPTYEWEQRPPSAELQAS